MKKNPAKICFDKKMVNNSGKLFILTTNLYKNANTTALLASKKWNTEGKADINLEETVANNQENMTTKQLATRKST